MRSTAASPSGSRCATTRTSPICRASRFIYSRARASCSTSAAELRTDLRLALARDARPVRALLFAVGARLAELRQRALAIGRGGALRRADLHLALAVDARPMRALG